ncbi:MAG: glycosyltransferase family 39 protein [Chloroflexota bacterium]|nr:glycosyltransferase family 39 protein [Chloroflexota bacterium]
MTSAPTGTGSSPPASQRWWIYACVAGIVVIAFALRVAWISHAGFAPGSYDDTDTGAYDSLGRALAAGAGYNNPDGTAHLLWPPGYPMILAVIYKATGDSLRAALLWNATLGALTAALTYAIGRRAFDGRTALLGALVVALFPSLIFFAGVTMTEVSFTFCLLAALWLLIESEAAGARWLLIPAGLIIGFASLTRGQAILLPLVAIPFWWRSIGSWRGALTRAAAVALLAVLVVAPWSARNLVRTGSFVPIAANFGIDLYLGHSAHADGGLIFTDDFTYPPGLSQQDVQVRMNRDAGRAAIEYAATHPLREVELSARKLYRLYYRDQEGLAWNHRHGARPVLSKHLYARLARMSDFWYWLVLAWAVFGVRAWLSTREPARLLLLSVVIYWTLVHIAFFGDPRFHAPIVPILALWAAAGVMAHLAPSVKIHARAAPIRSGRPSVP